MSDSTHPCRRCSEPRHYTGSRWRCSRCFNEWQTAWKMRRTEDQRRTATAKQTAARQKWSPEQRERAYAQSAAWREANQERYLAGARDWYKRNAEYSRAAKLAEYYRDPESFYARNLVRKARINDAVCVHGSKCVTAEFLRSMYDGACTYCGAPAEAADHFYPLARGGLHCVENLVPACQPCNSSKSARDPAEWLASLAS